MRKSLSCSCPQVGLEQPLFRIPDLAKAKPPRALSPGWGVGRIRAAAGRMECVCKSEPFTVEQREPQLPAALAGFSALSPR